LFIQIPCYNEAATLGITLDELPRALPGVDSVDWLVIDDGSSDATAEVARAHGTGHVVKLAINRGLSNAFMVGIDYCIRNGADIIVNTDADNQYSAADIPALIAPILRGEADIVVGARPIEDIAHFSPLKKLLQRLGSWVVRMASGTDIPDAPSGFRAMTRDAAMRLNCFNSYTYTLETIIQAGRKNMAIVSVPIHVNPDLRPSRLVKSIPSYVQQSLFTIVRIFMTYRPFRFFAGPGIVMMGIGVLPALRFLYLYSQGFGQGNVQSLIFGGLCLGIGGLLLVVGLLADLIGVNRMLLEDIRWRLRQAEYREHARKVREHESGR
jgi:glycosyltransferase involved in cell wall biosynthesis